MEEKTPPVNMLFDIFQHFYEALPMFSESVCRDNNIGKHKFLRSLRIKGNKWLSPGKKASILSCADNAVKHITDCVDKYRDDSTK